MSNRLLHHVDALFVVVVVVHEEGKKTTQPDLHNQDELARLAI